MPVRGPGPYQLRKLSARLREAGTEGQGLRRELYKAVTQAARPLAREVRDPGHLRDYMPNRYADVLSTDLSVTTLKSAGRNPGISIRARGRVHARKVVQRDQGVITHPVFGDRKRWARQTAGMRPGFFADPMERARPLIQRQVTQAMDAVGKKITS